MAFLFFHVILCDTLKKSRGKNLIIVPLKILSGAIIRDGDRNEMSFSLLGLSPCVVPKHLFLEKIAPCRVQHACK